MVHFVASDCHKDKHIDTLLQARKTEAYHTLLTQGNLRNNTLANNVVTAQ